MCLLFAVVALSILAKPAAAQETQRPDTTAGPPPQQGMGGPQQEGQVDFQATDSLVFNFRDDRVATLYGSSKVNHQAGELSAGRIDLNLDQHLVSANTQTPQDTLSQPVLVRENDRVRSNKIDFNYQTEKGRFEVARVGVGEGRVTGTKVKNTGPHVVYLEDAIYSTCELDHPHYYIKASRMKVVNEEEVFFTKARLYILDIPYPLVFPFGYLPGSFERKQSGLLEPTYSYQQQETRGLGLQNLGWFQYFNDYLTGQAAVDIFTTGTYYLTAGVNYRNRDQYTGSIDIGYSNERGFEPTDPDFANSAQVQRSIRINHNQDFSPYANISANINLQTADYYKRNSYDLDERAKTSTSSSINYRYRHPDNLYNFSISARQNRNFQTNRTQLSGPTANFSLKQFSPFSSDEPSLSGITPWYENLTLRYQNSFESDYQFDPLAGQDAEINWFEALFDPSKYREATGIDNHYNFGFRQQADISVGSILPSQYINMSANANYTEYWFPTSTRKTYNPVTELVEEEQIRGFHTARDFSTGLNFSTTVYGIMNRGIGSIQGFRHTLRPSIGFSYRPNFGSDFWGYYREVQTDSTGRTQIYSIFENEVFQGPSRGEQRALTFSLNNVFEAKQVRRDSTGEQRENTIRLIDNLNLSSSYNFAADSLKLSDLNASFNSSIIPGINIRANAQFNFYERNELGTKVDQYLLAESGRLMEMTNFSVSTSYSYSFGRGGIGGGRTNDNPYFPARYDPYNQSIFHEMDPNFNQQPVQRFNSPFSISFSFRYNWRLNPSTGGSTTSATINAQNIQFQLTPKWSFNTSLGYDFVEKEFTPSQFSLSRNLHCWNLNFSMSPFGEFQYYYFSLRVNSGQISGILQKLPLLNNLERSSSPTGRRPAGF